MQTESFYQTPVGGKQAHITFEFKSIGIENQIRTEKHIPIKEKPGFSHMDWKILERVEIASGIKTTINLRLLLTLYSLIPKTNTLFDNVNKRYDIKAD